jgi:hypothetical protein
MTATVVTQPYFIAYDGKYMWTSSFGYNTVSVVNVSDGALMANLTKNLQTPWDLAFDGTNMWIATYPGPVLRIPTPPFCNSFLPILSR